MKVHTLRLGFPPHRESFKMNHRMIFPCPHIFSSFRLQKSSFWSLFEAALPAAVNAAGPPLIRDDADASRTCVRTRQNSWWLQGLGPTYQRRGLERCKGVQLGLVSFGLKGFSCGVLELVANIPLELLREANDFHVRRVSRHVLQLPVFDEIMSGDKSIRFYVRPYAKSLCGRAVARKWNCFAFVSKVFWRSRQNKEANTVVLNFNSALIASNDF